MISSEHVDEIFNDCLFHEDEDTTSHIDAEGVVRNVSFHPERLQSHKTEIEEMLQELPHEFRKSAGGGWSFLNACLDKDGNQWTGLHLRMEQLFQLGIAIGKVKYMTPRKMWSAMPGGMPYLIIEY